MTSSILPLCTSKILSPQLFHDAARNQSFKVSCNVNNEEHYNFSSKNLDRRNVLLGLGGLYGAANLAAPLASAAPIPPPDLQMCDTALITNKGPDVPYTCCPPIPDDMDSVTYYEFPPMPKLRTRLPAHAVDDEYIAKYRLATSRMKELDKDPSNPLGFKQQANIHCAYCNGAYKVGGKELQVHFSWLFFPFHRWYLYFYERILGSLIDDPSFALPYWNWDNPKGMRLPLIFDVEGANSLYDARRNPNSRNGTTIDLAHFGDDAPTADKLVLISNNLTLMYRQMITNAPCPLLFFGKPYPLGTDPSPGMGTIENIPHTPVHTWVGTKRDEPNGKYGEDMGNFYSAALDPVFYSHHANVDRMWALWKTLGGRRKDVKDTDWLNSEFFFYDENRNPFRVKVRDCLDHKKMGYDFAPSPTPWRSSRPQKKSKKKLSTNLVEPAVDVFPISKLDKTISFSIKRPVLNRSQVEKDEQAEILSFNSVKYDNRKYVRFDVFLNEDNSVNADELDKAEYAGSYTSLPHVHAIRSNESNVMKVDFQIAITEPLEDIGLEDEDTIVVTLVPKKGNYISIDSVEIKLEDS